MAQPKQRSEFFGPHYAEVERRVAELAAAEPFVWRALTQQDGVEVRRIVQALTEVKPIRERVLDNMGSPGRFSECLFCHADDYDGWAGHREACLWERAKRLVEGSAAD